METETRTFSNSRWKNYFQASLAYLMQKYGLVDPLVVGTDTGEPFYLTSYYLAESSEVVPGAKIIMLYQKSVITHASRQELAMTALP